MMFWFMYDVAPTQVIDEITYPIYNSTMTLSPASGIFDVAFEQRISVLVETSGEPINAVGFKLRYDPEVVEVLDIIDNNTFCDAGFVVERSIDPVAGSVVYGCGTLTPVTEGTQAVIELLVRPKVTGNFELIIEDSSGVYANDGLGTNVLRSRTSASYQVRNSDDEALLFSRSHPNTTKWYNTQNAAFSWRALSDTGYKYDLRSEVATSSATARATNERHIEIPLTSDGVFYFHLWPQSGSTTEPLVHKIQVDTTPPPPPSVRFSDTTVAPGEIVRMEFATTDTASGVETPYYYVQYNDSIFFPVQSPFYTAFPEVGTHTITIRAYDNAGNKSETSQTVVVEPSQDQSFVGGPAAVLQAFPQLLP